MKKYVKHVKYAKPIKTVLYAVVTVCILLTRYIFKPFVTSCNLHPIIASSCGNILVFMFLYLFHSLTQSTAYWAVTCSALLTLERIFEAVLTHDVMTKFISNKLKEKEVTIK